MTRKIYKFDKLIRDKVYERIEANPVVDATLKDLSYPDKLLYFKKKLYEEVEEIDRAATPEEWIEEAADLLEVLKGFAHMLRIDFSQIEAARLAKREKNGGFDKAVIVEDVRLDEAHEFARYFQTNPDKYPEVA